MSRLFLSAATLGVALSVAACDADGPHERAAETLIPDNEGAVSVPTSPATGVRLAVAVSSPHGRYLADSQGRPLYVRVNAADQPCDGDCAEQWLPLLANQPPAAAGEPAVREDLIGTTIRGDGTMQVTYADRPLFYRDEEYGVENLETTVTDAFGTWSLILPEGLPIEQGR